MGHEIIAQAEDGYEAIKAYKKYLPDIVTLDITMPKKNGIDTLMEIKNINPKAKVIMVSSNHEQSSILDALHKGANGYINKPIEEDKFKKVISRLAS